MSEMTGLYPAIILVIMAMALLIAEFFIPSGGLIGLTSLAMAVVGVFLAFKEGEIYGYIFLVFTIAGGISGIILGGRLLAKSPLANRTSLAREDGYSATRDRSRLVGQTGHAHTMLRPSGIAQIGKERVQVVAESGIIEAETPIKIVEVEGNRIVVRPEEAAGPDSEKETVST